MSIISADIEWMPLSNQGFNYILFATCEFSNYVIGLSIQKENVVTIAETLLNRVVYQLGPPQTLIIGVDRTLSAVVLMHIYNILNIRSQVISPLSNGSLRTERYIRSTGEMLCKPLTKTGEDWHLCVNPCCYALNTYVSPSTEYSVFKLMYLHKQVDLIQIAYSPLQHLSRSHDDYIKKLKKRFDVMKKVVLNKRTQDHSVQEIKQRRTFPRNQTFAVGDLAYLFAPSAASLQTRSKKFTEDWIGSLLVKAVLDKSHYLLADWHGKLLPFSGAVHIHKLKPCYLNLVKHKLRF